MKESKIIKAIPVYNDIHEVTREIRILQLLRSNLKGKAVLDLQLHIKGALSMRVEGNQPDFGLGLIISIINHKKEIKTELQNKLDLI